MAMSDDLFRAILAMDAYNRGYNAGIGNATVGLGGAGTQIGLATVGQNSSVLGAGTDVAASFFAQAYSLPGNKTVISYRGTDDVSADSPAFLMGGGAYDTTQGNLAIDFYKTINGGSATRNTNIEVTGHSLGGGLAGYVGSLYGLTEHLQRIAA